MEAGITKNVLFFTKTPDVSGRSLLEVHLATFMIVYGSLKIL